MKSELHTRRAAIGKGMVVLGAALTPGLAVGGEDRRRKQPRAVNSGSLAHELSEDHWANLVDHKFDIVRFSFEEGPMRSQLVLLETAKHETKRRDIDRPVGLKPNATMLLFRGPARFKLIDTSYRIKHPWLGEFDMLLSYTEAEQYKNDNVYSVVLNC